MGSNVHLSHAFTILRQGATAMDTLRQWQRTYSRELDHETKQECIATERLLRRALAGGGEAFTSSHQFILGLPVFKYPFEHSFYHLSLSDTVPAAPAPAKPFDALQDSQLFDAENSEPLSSSGGGCSSSQDWPQTSRNSEVNAVPTSPKRWQSSSSAQRHRARGTEAAVLYGVKSGKLFLQMLWSNTNSEIIQTQVQ